MKIYFDVQEMYYLPQYIPIQKELSKLGAESIFVFYSGFNEQILSVSVKYEISIDSIKFVSNASDALQLYLVEKPDWLILGNNCEGFDKIGKDTKTALVSHGIGPKSCYYTASGTPTDVRFVEGPYRTERLEQMYPNQTFIDTGYAKLDPAVNGEFADIKPTDYGLNDNKKTILYAPTFYPSSIERFKREFPHDFEEYNIILKPHYFSLSISKYKKQKQLLEHWAKFDNVYLATKEESNILPFMVISDVLISDASSTLFEFAALGKPVVWCDFLKLRWGYRGVLKFRFKKRMDQDLYRYADIAAHANTYQELKSVVNSQIEFPEQYAGQRSRYTLSLAGIVDGNASKRIAQYLIENN